MKKVVLAGMLVLGTLFTACGQRSEAALDALSFGELPLVTDTEALLEPLSTFGVIHLAETEELGELALAQGAGLVGYTPLPDGDWGVLEKLPEVINPMCLLILCDDEGNPVPDSYDGFTVGQDLLAVYATPTFVERVAQYGIGAEDLQLLDAAALVEMVVETGVRVGSVGLYGPDSPMARYCATRPVPHVCKIMSVAGVDVLELDVSEVAKTSGVGLIITDFGALTRLDTVGELTQLHGEGFTPVFSALQVGFPQTVNKAAAASFLENIYSDEGQIRLAQAGVIPVTERAFAEIVRGDLAVHVEAALRARPTPIPVD